MKIWIMLMTAIIITAGAFFAYWFSSVIRSQPSANTVSRKTLEIKEDIYKKIVNENPTSTDLPLDSADFGRTDPFGKY